MAKTKEQKEEEKRIKAEADDKKKIDNKEAEKNTLGATTTTPNVGEHSATNVPPPATPSASTTTVIKDKNEEVVEIKKADYEKLMNQLERNAKDIDLLYKASDKQRMARAMNEGGEILIKKVNIWTWDNTGAIVIATKMLNNRSEVIAGKWIEDQTVEVFFEDGKSVIVPYLEFVRKILHKIPAEIVSTTKTRDSRNVESIVYRVQFESGKQMDINSAFVN